MRALLALALLLPLPATAQEAGPIRISNTGSVHGPYTVEIWPDRSRTQIFGQSVITVERAIDRSRYEEALAIAERGLPPRLHRTLEFCVDYGVDVIELPDGRTGTATCPDRRMRRAMDQILVLFAPQ